MFHNSWKEELEHADKLRQYGVKRGALITVPDLSDLEVKIYLI
jgi:ferritin